MTDTNAIAILGCGWLGLPLALRLINDGIRVKGSSTSDGKIASLTESGVEPFVIRFTGSGVTGDIEGLLQDCRILIITTPPGKTEGPFDDAIATLIPYIKKSGIRKVMMISSTSVYGKNTGIVSGETIPLPETSSAVALLKAEKLLSDEQAFKNTIVRFGGLTGKERHPVKFLAGKKSLTNGDAPVNLIHLNDCIGIITAILNKDAWGYTFNAVWPSHPPKRAYYREKAEEYGLEPPTFLAGGEDGKIITDGLVSTYLDYKYTTRP